MNLISNSETWKMIGNMVIVFGFFGGIFYAATKFIIIEYIGYGLIGISIVTFIIIVIKELIIPLISELHNYFVQNKMLKKLDFQSFNNREDIYCQFKVFSNDKIKLKFVKLLGLYIHNVSGEWPNKDIFRITSNPANILLAQLEEKWLGINR